MSESTIKKCDCSHKFQDERYGKGNRVHNKMKRKEGSSMPFKWRCTVCKEKQE